MAQFSLTGKRALITGATRGIGLAIARGLAAAGAEIWIHGKEAAEAEIATAMGAHFVAADLSRESEIAALAMQLRSQVDSLHVLVNNAGIETLMPIGQLSVDIMDRVWRVNARAPLQLLYELLPLLKAPGNASVINITSIHEQTPYAGNLPYCMSKAALSMATKVASLELSPFRIRVNNLAPGAIETDINREVIDAIGRESFAEWIPAGRVGSTEELVGPAVFLASDASSYMTGATLLVDGGYSQNLVRYRPTELGRQEPV